MTDPDRENPQEDNRMITKRSFVSLARAGCLAALFPDAIRMAAAQTVFRMLVGFGAGAIVDDERRGVILHSLNQHPGNHVDRAAGTEAHQHA